MRVEGLACVTWVPWWQVGGEERGADGRPAKPTYDSPRSYCMLARQELGLRPHPIGETLWETGRSYQALGLLADRPAAKM